MHAGCHPLTGSARPSSREPALRVTIVQAADRGLSVVVLSSWLRRCDPASSRLAQPGTERPRRVQVRTAGCHARALAPSRSQAPERALPCHRRWGSHSSAPWRRFRPCLAESASSLAVAAFK